MRWVVVVVKHACLENPVNIAYEMFMRSTKLAKRQDASQLCLLPPARVLRTPAQHHRHISPFCHLILFVINNERKNLLDSQLGQSHMHEAPHRCA